MDVLIRAAEGADPDPYLLWDSRWEPFAGQADWAMAAATETLNRGGLAATAGLETAVILALFTDRRMPADHALAYLADGDPRGWWGDGVDVRADLGEDQLGSLLWVLERAPLTVQGLSITYWAEQMALEALKPIRSQGAVVRIEATALANEVENRLELRVRLYGRDDASVYDRKFDLLWSQLR